MIIFQPVLKQQAHARLIFLTTDQVKKKRFGKGVAASFRSELAALADGGQFVGNKAEIFPVARGGQLIVLAGLGDKKDLSGTQTRIAVRRACRSSFLAKARTIEIVPHDTANEAVRAYVEGIVLGTYRWDKYRKPARDTVALSQKKYYFPIPDLKAYQNILTIAHNVNSIRDLVNDNADTVDSDHLEKTVRSVVKGRKNVSCEILNKKELKAKGLNLHLAVNQGSPKEPKLIIVKYQGAAKTKPWTAVIGKGITFDTGGLNLKPTGYIETMRCDMGGAAAVIGILKNSLDLKLKKNVIFVLGVAENAVGSRAYKPGDVFVSYHGKTVEIGNTDAEGRLVLADAISYIAKTYRPARIIDLATLTGACVVALGHDHTGLVSNDPLLVKELTQAAKVTDDRVWQLPSYPELKDAVKSQVADIRNMGFPKGAAGTLTAAEFLRQFTEDLPWAHLDIAGTAFVADKERWYYDHGATGAGVRLVTEFLERF